jgi:hypothetical protein
MSIRKSIAIAVVAVASLFASAIASAGGNDFALSASVQSQFVSPGEQATVNWLAWNNTGDVAFCEVSVLELGTTLFSDVIQPLSTVNGQFSTAVAERNAKLTFVLSCGGSPVARRAVNVKLR